jgi:hypothetical protein
MYCLDTELVSLEKVQISYRDSPHATDAKGIHLTANALATSVMES